VGLCACSEDFLVEVMVNKADGGYYSVLLHEQDLPLVYGETLNFTANRYIKITRPYDHVDSTKNGMIYENAMLHRVVLFGKAEKRNELYVDHINENGLDNRRCNLRQATFDQNIWHSRPKKTDKCKYKGVSFRKANKKKKWLARLTMQGKIKYNKCFLTKEEAALAYDEAAKKYHKEWAWLNRDHYPEDFE
jgi:uncharacterized protein YjbI with pentapeptide repeats